MNQIDLKNKNAVVTGAAGGIGSAIVERFLQSGAKVDLWDLNESSLKTVAKSFEGLGEVRVTAVDIRNPEQVQQAAQDSKTAMGSIDILVNSAGITGVSKKLWECTAEEWREVIELNLFGTFLCCHAIVPTMRQGNYGRIVNIARQYRLHCREGRQSERLPLQCHQSRSHWAYEITRQRIGRHRDTCQLRYSCGYQNGNFEAAQSGTYRLYAIQNTFGSIRGTRGSRRHGRLVKF